MKDIMQLIKELKHKDDNVRQNAAETLGIMGDEKAIDSLILALKDKNKFVRQEVVSALGRIGDRNLLEPLTRALAEEKDEYVKLFINKVLDKLQK